LLKGFSELSDVRRPPVCRDVFTGMSASRRDHPSELMESRKDAEAMASFGLEYRGVASPTCVWAGTGRLSLAGGRVWKAGAGTDVTAVSDSSELVADAR